jgi:rRNA maturation endonuclease Nob1
MSEDDEICPKCGDPIWVCRSVGVSPVYTKTVKMKFKVVTVCPECGHHNPKNQRGCNNCGHVYNPPFRSSVTSTKVSE